jgi:hypothetical protein
MENLFLVSIVSFFLGLFFHFFVSSLVSKLKQKKNDEMVEEYFREIDKGIKSGLSKFITRVNNIVVISTTMNDFGDVSITYNMDTKEIIVMKDNKEILTSDKINLKEKIKLSKIIEDTHSKQIQDVVDIFGQLLNREEFEKSMKETLEKFKIITDGINITPEPKKETKFDIDEILDKINKVGIENLTKEEKDFLNKFNK